MFLSNGICISVMLFCTATFETHAAYSRSDASDQIGHLLENRTRRALVTSVYKGIKAVENLLRSAIKDPMVSKYSRQKKYVKQGDLLTALMDFSSLSPKNVRSFQQPNKMYGEVGFVGDKTVIVRQEITGLPFIKIFKTAEANNPKSKRTIITYKPTTDPPWEAIL